MKANNEGFERELRRIAHVYTDAGVITTGNSPLGFTWAYVLTDQQDELMAYASGYCKPSEFDMPTTENNFAETYAAMRGLQAIPDGACIERFCLDNLNALRRLSQPTKWNGVPDAVRGEIAVQLKRVSIKEFILLGGHPCQKALKTGRRCGDGKAVSRWNVECDRLCNEEKRKAGKR